MKRDREAVAAVSTKLSSWLAVESGLFKWESGTEILRGLQLILRPATDWKLTLMARPGPLPGDEQLRQR